MQGFNRGKATRAFAEAGVINETGIIGLTMPLGIALTAVPQCWQFSHLLRQ